MKKKIRFTALFLSLTSLLGFFGCKNVGGDSESSSTLPPIEETEKEEDNIDKSTVLGMIADGGKSEYKIVYSTQATTAEKHAAAELSEFIAQSTSTTLEITVDSKVAYDVNAKYISIGNTTLLEETGITIDAKELNQDGFIMKTVGRNLYIAGANNRGVLYGVYDFLETEKFCVFW